MNWFKSQVEYLKQSFPITKDGAVASVIGKSANAIRIKASRLGLRKQSSLIRENLILSGTEEQVVVGGLFGDLSCRISETSRYARLEGGHCARQKEYMLWKVGLMRRFNFWIYQNRDGNYLYQSKSFNAFNRYYHLFYPNGKKHVTYEALNLLNDFGLLIWYLDDGSYHKRDRTLRLYTNGFSLQEQEIICDWFYRKYDITPKITITKSRKIYPNKQWYLLAFHTADSKKLLNIFKNFDIPSCMKYKLGIITHSTSLNDIEGNALGG